MVIFSRNRGSGGRHSAAEPGRGRHERRRADAPAAEESLTESADVDAGGADARPDFGPYDISQAPDDDQARLDLGALQIPAVAGVEVQLQAGSQGQVHGVQLAHGGSRLQLAVFAAPRTEGIWDEIRATLRNSLAASGGRPHEVEGEYGPELRARIKEGSGTTEVRHVGVDGPRWFVHGVYLGAAAADPDRAGPLREVLRGLIVDRGPEARPISEALPLRLPPEAAAQLAEAAGEPPESQAT